MGKAPIWECVESLSGTLLRNAWTPNTINCQCLGNVFPLNLLRVDNGSQGKVTLVLFVHRQEAPAHLEVGKVVCLVSHSEAFTCFVCVV